MIFKKIYKIRIVYKSGYHHDFWCKSFTITQNKQTCEWESIYDERPLLISIDNIESVWTLKTKLRFAR